MVAVLFLTFLLPISLHAEQAFPVIQVGSEIDFPPYAIVDAKGRASGFSVELLAAVAEAMGLPIEVHTGPWSEVLATFKAGKFDLLPLVALSKERAEMATYTKPHTVTYDSFFVRRGSRPISALAEATGKEVIVMENDAAHEALLNSGLAVRLVETKTIPEAMRLLASGQHDAVLVPKLLGLIVLRDTKRAGIIEASQPIADYDRQFAFAVQRGNTALRDSLEQGLAMVHANGRYDAIYKKWFGGIEPMSQRLRTIIVDNYQPYTFINDKGEADGFTVELIRAVAQEMGLELEIRAGIWEQALKELAAGSIDMLPMMAHSPERELLFDFSIPHTIAYDAIFVKKGGTALRSLQDLTGKTVIVMNKDMAHSYLLSSGLSETMHLKLVDSLPEALRQLDSGQGDAAIMPKLVGMLTLKSLKLLSIDNAPAVISEYTRPFSFAVTEGNQALLERLNQGLNIIKLNGQYDTIYQKWFGSLEGRHVDWQVVKKIGSMAALLMLVVIIWNIVLNRQVRIKTAHLADEIKQREKNAKALQVSEERYALAVSGSNEGIWDWDIVTNANYFSPRFCGLLGYEPGEIAHELVTFESLLHPADQERVLDAIRRHLEELLPYDVEYRLHLKNGDYRWFHARGQAIWDEAGKPFRMAGSIADITEKKLVDEELVKANDLRLSILNSISDAFFSLDDNLVITYFNKTAEEILGKRPKEVVGNKLFDVFPEARGSIFEETYTKAVKEKIPLSFETYFAASPYENWFSVNVYPYEDGISVYFKVITERKLAEEKMAASLHEKELLLKEIHHRVKNNLQIIISLLKLQANYITDEQVKEHFRECQQRIAAMADVHTLLYKSQNFAQINFADYVQGMTKQLFQAYRTGHAAIGLVIQMSDIMLPIDNAIPCGLLINELLTNSLKYAFPGGRKGKISIEMQRTADGVRLILSDNGIGFPTEMDFSKTETFGLRLVQMLVKQLDGSIEWSAENGTRYVIMFKPTAIREIGHASA